MSIEAMRQALEALEAINEMSKPPMNIPLAAEIDGAMDALRQAIEQAKKPHPDHYAEVYIRVGDLHIKKVMTQIEYSQAYDPMKLLSLMADDCVQNLKVTK
jgi:hypothetical protein